MENKNEKWYRVDRELLRVKGFYFLTFAAIGCLFPYVSLYVKALGITQSHAGLIFGILPFIEFCVQPTVGLIADKLQKHRCCLILCCILTGIFYNTLRFVPSSHSKFSMVSTDVVCGHFGSYISSCVNESKQHSCPLDFSRYITTQRELSNETNINSGPTTNIRYFEFHEKSIDCNINCHQKQESSSSIKNVCFSQGSDLNIRSDCSNSVIDDNTNVEFMSTIFLYPFLQLSNDSSHTCHQYNFDSFLFSGQKYKKMHCASNATLTCNLTCNPIDTCVTTKTNVLSHLSFWMFFGLLLLGRISYTPITSLFDAISYNLLGEEKRNKWGQQRLWANVSLSIFAISSGIIMDKMVTDGSNKHFDIAFYSYGVLFLIVAVYMCTSRTSVNISGKQVFKGAVKTFLNCRILSFFIVISFFGFLSGALDSFLFWFLEAELQNKLKIIPGLCMLFNSIGEIIFFYFAGKIIERFGHLKCLYAVFVAHSVRFISYSFLTHAWFILPIELLNGVTFSLMWTTATSFGSIIAPRGLSGTIQGVLSGIYFGFGKGVGSLVTGELYTWIGIRWTFRTYGIISLVLLVLYVVLNSVVLKTTNTVNRQMAPRINEKDVSGDFNVEFWNGRDASENLLSRTEKSVPNE